MSKFEHVLPALRGLCAASAEERSAYLSEPRWFGYAAANEALRMLRTVTTQPRKARPANMALVGETNNGKTRIVQRFVELCAVEGAGGDELPILVVIAPPEPSESRLLRAMLNEIGAPYGVRERNEELIERLVRLVTTKGIRAFVIDEFHNALRHSNVSVQRYLGALKRISIITQTPIIAVGTNALLSGLTIDPEMMNRFRFRAKLPLWREGEAFQGLLASFELTLPLRKPSLLGREVLAARIYAMSEGLLGEVADLLEAAGIAAVELGTECIDQDVLNGLEWVPPSQR